MKKKYSFRKLVNDLHLWLGIGSGLVLFIVCLTGTLYTFRSEIEQILEPQKYTLALTSQAAPLPAEVLIEEVKTAVGGKVVSIEVPHRKDKPYLLTVKKAPEERRGTTYFINPYTGALLGTSEGPATAFFMQVFKLHRWLLLDTDTGRPIVGVATLVFVFLIFSGLILWCPKKLKHWKQGFVIKTGANWKRINHDLHNTLGFYSSLLLLIMALTGLCWSFDWYKKGMGALIGTEVFGGRGEKPVEAAMPAAPANTLSYAELMLRADEVLPYEGNYRIALPEDSAAKVVLNKYETGFFALAASDKVQLHLYTGEVLSVERFTDKPFNQQIASSIKPLHTGEIFGTFSKILYFIACLVGTSLPVTGIIIWINKLRKPAGKEKKQADQQLAVSP